MNLEYVKSLIENNPVALATVMSGGKPNIIGVTFAKIVGEEKVLITDNYMNQTVKDIKNNKNVCLAVWDKDLKGVKLIGEAEYFSEGSWKKFVEEMSENKGLPAKGAILVKISKIIESK